MPQYILHNENNNSFIFINKNNIDSQEDNNNINKDLATFISSVIDQFINKNNKEICLYIKYILKDKIF